MSVENRLCEKDDIYFCVNKITLKKGKILFWKRSPKKLGEGSFGQVYIYPAKINRK
jgi:hypothetical protein